MSKVLKNLTFSIIALLPLQLLALPDLNVRVVQPEFPNVSPPGEGPVAVYFEVHNTGDAAARNFFIGVYSAPERSCSIPTERQITTYFINNLNPGTFVFGTFPLEALPGETRIYARVKADISRTVTENSENNNCLGSGVVIVRYPDLRIPSTSGPSPNIFVAGEAGATFVTSLRNVRPNDVGWPAGPSITAYYLSQASSNPPETDRIPGLQSEAGALDTDQSLDQLIEIAIPKGTPEGTYNLFAKADASDSVEEGDGENNNFTARRQIEVVDICTFTDFNESGSVDILDLTQVVNNLGRSIYLRNQRLNVKRSHHPFPENINRVDLLAAVGCWNNLQANAQGGSLHDLSLTATGSGYAVHALLSGNVSSIETMVVLPAGTELGFWDDFYDILNSNFVETRYPGDLYNQVYTLNTFPSYFNNYRSLAYSNYQPITFTTEQNINLGSLQPLAPGETFTSGVAVQVVFADGQVASLKKKFAFVHAPDANFRNALKTQLGLASDQAIPSALAQTVTSLTLNNANISNLSGLEQFTNLVHLSLADNAIQKLPDLSGFNQLKTLDLSGNQIYRFPALPSGLETLDISSNGLWDLPSLNHLTQLESLDVSANPLTQLPALAALTALHTLIANDANLVALPTLPMNLKHLEAEHNHLISLPAFQGPIVSVSVRHNYISNVSSLQGAVNSNTTHVLLDHNMLDANFCTAYEAIIKGSRGNLQVFTFTHQLVPEINCAISISL